MVAGPDAGEPAGPGAEAPAGLDAGGRGVPAGRTVPMRSGASKPVSLQRNGNEI